MEHTTEVYAPWPARFNMVGQKLPTQMHLTEEKISQGLATRLLRYAEKALDAEGFLDAVAGWEVTIGTDNADERPADRFYWVKWTNPKGASLSITGILTSRGWPHLDHGMQIDRA
ncbi:hypothetical protein [Pseudomonas aeruginosa]|uniref:hypothetical protein n=1 Tax=Pseudomonas aeruginosa TaxID=287 RepID=UPI003D028135